MFIYSMWLFILIIIVFILLILLNVLNIFKMKELFKSDYSDYNTIDRIEVDDTFAYCIGAKARCETGAPIKGGVYNNGDTYRSFCDDGSNMICNNFFLTNFDLSGNNYIWRTPNNTPILFSQEYKGFTEPTSDITPVINNNLINFYDKNNILIDSIDKCSILGINENNCKKALNIPFPFANKSYTYQSGTDTYAADASNNQLGYFSSPSVIGNFVSSYTQTTPQSAGVSGMYQNLPCIADYGALPGDNVCNGEVGLIQDTTLVCPYYKPICSGYRCGSTFGHCEYSN